jgi:hypothetical protein
MSFQERGKKYQMVKESWKAQEKKLQDLESIIKIDKSPAGKESLTASRNNFTCRRCYFK